MIRKDNWLQDLKDYFLREKKSIKELYYLINYLGKVKNKEEMEMVSSQINSLKNSLKKINETALETLEKINLAKPLTHKSKEINKEVPRKKIKILPVSQKQNFKQIPFKKTLFGKKHVKDKEEKESLISKLEKRTLKRLKKRKEKVVKKKVKKPSKYIKLSNNIFSNLSKSYVKKPFFRTLGRDLIKSKLQFTPISYISVILFTTLISVVAGAVIFLFFLFFNIGTELPIITAVSETSGERFVKVFWILFFVPVATFLIMYFYPSLEKKSAEVKINRELPFATIHMAAISGSMIEPSKIFSIIISTKEYPSLEKEFIKIINEINIYGYDLATALRNVAFNSPSKKLAELLNGLATTIQSGGDLPDFFEKRSQTLLFEHRIEKEKHAKSAETFMDIYISVVIAAPMILMLLLMMMSVSGLSWLSPSMITIIMILGVVAVNIIFLAFLHLKGSTE